ncbi:MAG: Na/Pi symporter [Victivallaceae bacterium]|nr:Na/Pi symporter [Victivallaceae bacterium]
MKSLRILLSVLFSTLALLAGCSKSDNQQKVAALRVIDGGEQCTMPGTEFPRKLRVQAETEPEFNWLGQRKDPEPIPHVNLCFTAARGSDISVLETLTETDEGGGASVTVIAGTAVGDHYVNVHPEGRPDLSLTIRFTTGVAFDGDGQEGLAGHEPGKPIGVTVVDAHGNPASGVPVYFCVKSGPGGSRGEVANPTVVTDEKGHAGTTVRLGKRTGAYDFGVEVADKDRSVFVRLSSIRVFGIDIYGVIITLIGGITFFVSGMTLLSDGLKMIAGENMKKVLQFFSRNGFIAVVAGAFVTAVIHSSAATTVMVMGFLNAGLIDLTQAIGIIFGANVGTTITAQMISFNLESISLPCVAIGFCLGFVKRRVAKGWGEAIMGFGLLFFGMSMMSGELKVLGTFNSFIQFFKGISCAPVVNGGPMPCLAILWAMLIGAAATVAIQSSTAAMGIIIALASGGLIDFYTSVPLLIGTNIGTTVTAAVAALPANRVAKQAAVAHCLFNLFGAAMMLGLFYVPYPGTKTPIFLYVVNELTPGNAFAEIPQNITHAVAMAHTLFNVITVLVIFPFIRPFSKLCAFLVPAGKDESIHTLEPLLLNTPGIAIEQSCNEIGRMVCIAWAMVDIAFNRHFMRENMDEDDIEKLEKAEERVDTMQTDITDYLVQITRRRLTNHQSNLIPLLMHCTNDAERVADHTENLVTLTKRLIKSDASLSDAAKDELNGIWELLNDQAMHVMLLLARASRAKVTSTDIGSKRIAKKVSGYLEQVAELGKTHSPDPDVMLGESRLFEQQINARIRKVEKAHAARRNAGTCSLEANVIFVELLGELERIGKRLSNIAERAPEISRNTTKNRGTRNLEVRGVNQRPENEPK